MPFTKPLALKTVEKILTVTVQNTVDEDDEDDEGTEDTGGSGKEKGPVKAGNAEVTAQAVLLSPLALSTRLIRLLVWLSAKLT
jgi:hypothetical protein